VPKRVAFIDSFPRSHFGKVLKRELRDQKFTRTHVQKRIERNSGKD